MKLERIGVAVGLLLVALGPLGAVVVSAGDVKARLEVQQRRAAESSGGRPRLERFGWVDQEAGVVHVPIEVAFELLLLPRATARRAPR